MQRASPTASADNAYFRNPRNKTVRSLVSATVTAAAAVLLPAIRNASVGASSESLPWKAGTRRGTRLSTRRSNGCALRGGETAADAINPASTCREPMPYLRRMAGFALKLLFQSGYSVFMGIDAGIALGRIQRRRAVDDVHQAIREAILDRRFPPGSRLNVEELAFQLGVSLTPVRAAIQLLAAEGLIDVHSRSGTFVATLSRRDLDETFDIRCALECLAGEKAAASIGDVQLDRVRKLMAALAKPVKSDAQRKAHEQTNSEFHEIIIHAAGNRRLIDMYESLRAHIAMCRLHRIDEGWRSRLPIEHEEHEAIAEALYARDAKAVVKALRNHILRAKENLLATIDDAAATE